MKKWKNLFLCLAALVCLILLATPKAEAEIYGKMTYTISDGEVTITACNTSATGELVIPDTIDGYPVTTIAYQAFYYCSRLTGVTISDSVIEIGANAFAWCTGLTSVTIESGLTDISSSAFYGCSGLTSVVIPESVTGIWAGAFEECYNLKNVYYTGSE